MRIVAGFIAVCVLMLGLTVWQIAGHWQAIAPPQGSATGISGEHTASESAERGAADTAAATPQPGSVPRQNGIEASDPRDSTRAQPLPAGASPITVEKRVPEPKAANSSEVRWARTAEAREARRRLERSQAALRKDPDSEPALRDQLAALVALGRWSDAAETLERLVRRQPEDNGQRYEHGTLLVQARRWSDAAAVLQEVVNREPGHARAWFNLATARQAAGHLQDALTAWNRAIELAPETAALAARGEVLLDLHDWTRAAADFRRVIAAEPRARDALLNLTLALWKSGQAEEARKLLIDHVQKQPRDVPALLRLADIAWESYQADPARRAAQRREVIAWCRKVLAIERNQAHARELLQQVEKE